MNKLLRFSKSHLFLFFLSILSFQNSYATLTGFGDGSDGNITYTSGTHYMDNVKSGIVSMSFSSVTLNSVSGFSAGDAILIINPISGAFSFERVSYILSNTLHIFTSFPSIFPVAKTQVIKLYEFDTLTVSGSAILTCSPFDSTTGLGGVISFLVKNNFEMNGGLLDAHAKGFHGGNMGLPGSGGLGGPGGVNGGYGVGSAVGKFGAGHGGRNGDNGFFGILPTNPTFPGNGAPSSNTSLSSTLRFGGGGNGGNGGRGGYGSAGSGGITCNPGLDGNLGPEGGNGALGGRGGGIIVIKAANLFSTSTIFDVSGEDGGSATDGEDGSVGADGVCGGGGGNGSEGGAGGNGGSGGAGGKIRITSLGTLPTLSQLNYLSGSGGPAGTGGLGGNGGLSSNDFCVCGSGTGILPPGGTCGNKCNMRKVLEYIDSTTTIISPGNYTDGSRINCEFSMPFYSEDLGLDYVVGTCIVDAACMYVGYMTYDPSLFNAIGHLVLDDATTTIGAFDFLAPEGLYAYTTCDINGSAGPAGPNGVDGSNGGPGAFEFDTEPLAVLLNNFTVSCRMNSALIEWDTKAESNNKSFTIYKSSDGVNREKVAEIPGAGNSNIPVKYSWSDPNFDAQKPYYYLSQSDFDGSISWIGIGLADCLEVLSSQTSAGYVSESKSIYIHFKDVPQNTRTQWSLYNSSGVKLSAGKIDPLSNSTHFIQKINYPKGIYFLQVNNGLKNETHRIVIQ